ncbi:MAG: SIS domain-containing protein [Erysipelotrichaceae bacterium]|nr:SIS domain-containing protein [Erysipelotrichaceae bacterium]
MGTLLDTIAATPLVIDDLISKREENYGPVIEYIKRNVSNINEIVLIGSGSSLNEAKSGRGFVEKVTGIRVTCETSNDFMYNHFVFDTNNLYVCMSQSGTSETTRRAQKMLREKGCHTIAISSETQKFLALESCAYIDSMASREEYLCVTMGYSASLIALELFGLELGKYLNHISIEEYETYIDDLIKAKNNYPSIINKVDEWYKSNEEKVMSANYYAVYGADDLWGVALEMALKITETPKLFAVGYELEDGMHGPTMSFDDKICVFILNDGKREDERCKQLANFVKSEYNNGFIIGSSVLDNRDLKLDFASTSFQNLEFACAIQTINWFMSVSNNIDLTLGNGVAHVGKKYFHTHSQISL